MAWLRLAYRHILYWGFGTLPEEHHAGLAEIWYDLNRYGKCIEHCRKYLSFANSDRMKAMMGYCHAALSEWTQAAEAYRSMSDVWSNPSFVLALAEAELRCGEVAEARRIVAIVEATNRDQQANLKLSLDHIKKELATCEVID